MQEHGRYTVNQIANLLHEKYDRVFIYSSISESLSNNFKQLGDEEYPVNPDFNIKRTSYWPDLDAAVSSCDQQMPRKKPLLQTIPSNGWPRKSFMSSFHRVILSPLGF